ncbi:MAG: hypothetical protein O3B47_01180 [bacterium]|nr:hypothetical protein [bacterium]
MLAELTQLGLSQEEAKVYLATLELGGSYASNIARKAGVNRATCYHTLNNLKSKGFLNSFNKGKVLWFNAEPPQVIANIQEEKLEKAKELIPQLLSISNTLAFKPKIRFYEGIEGVKTIFEDILNTKEELLGYTNLNGLGNIMSDYFKKFCEKKIKNKIKTRIISPSTKDATKLIKQFYPKDYDKNLVEILLVNKDEFYFENDISIYENKVAVVSLNPDEVIGLIIESPTLAKSMRSIFNLAWLGATAFVAR